MAVAQAKIRSIGAAQSPLLGAAMFSPAVLYILLLVAGPFFLAIFYAFSDARIGNTEMHFVGLENFRSILQSPSFRVAIRNSEVSPGHSPCRIWFGTRPSPGGGLARGTRKRNPLRKRCWWQAVPAQGCPTNAVGEDSP